MMTMVRSVLRLAVPTRARPWVALEVVLITGFAYLIGRHYSPEDPLFIGSQFQWLWLAPALIACRYGVFAGFASIGVLLALWWSGFGPVAIDDPFPKVHFLGGMLLTYICGQFSEVWNSRLARAREVASYYQSRLDTLARNHYLLRLSHDRLLQDALIKPATLRDTMERIRDQAMSQAGVDKPNTAEFMRLIGQLCQIEVGTLHAVDNERPVAAALSSLGEMRELDVRDPLVQKAIESNELAHVQMVAIRERNPSRYLVCAPAVDSFGQARFFLAVERMPFLALTREALQTLAVVLGYYADGFAAGQIIAPIRARVPEAPMDFALEVARLTRIAREIHIESRIAALVCEPVPRVEEGISQVLRVRRSRDVTWEHERGGRRVLITVMPLAGEAALQGYWMRVEKVIREAIGVDLGQGGIVPHSVVIDGTDPAALVSELLERCDAQGASVVAEREAALTEPHDA